jgi:hypothetical protein
MLETAGGEGSSRSLHVFEKVVEAPLGGGDPGG